jgi:hypothetical protein
VQGVVLDGASGSATVQTTVSYLTSLDEYSVTETLSMVQRQGRWFIQLPQASQATPPDQFLSRATVGFLSQGRTSIGDTTSAIDVLDRPELVLSDVKSMRVDERWIVVGRVTNVDTVPADVTVQAQLRDANGTLLASWDAAQVLVHKLRPGASSSFRIEFQSIAGTGEYGTEANGGIAQSTTGTAVVSVPQLKKASQLGPVEFDPRAITPLVLPEGAEVNDVAVYARAVVSPHLAPEGLTVTGLHVETDGNGESAIVGAVRNDGLVEATVPHILLSYLDETGALAWLDHAYLASSIAPQKAAEFRITIPSSINRKPTGVATSWFAGPAHSTEVGAIRPLLELPVGLGFTSVAIDVTSYVRSTR